MSQFLGYLALFVFLLSRVVFVIGVLVALAALLSWAVRTRKISPFSSLARFSRRIDGPLFGPMERRILRAGGTPASAPWWTLAAVVIGSLILLSLLRFIGEQLSLLASSLSGDGGVPIAAVVVYWVFGFLQIAILARVISSWVGGGPYSKWWRWSYVSTEWFMGPLRRVLPTIGPIDISPLVAYFGLKLIQGMVMSAIR